LIELDMQAIEKVAWEGSVGRCCVSFEIGGEGGFQGLEGGENGRSLEKLDRLDGVSRSNQEIE